MKLSEVAERQQLKLATIEYTMEEEGNFIPEPIIQLFCRDSHGNRRYVEVEGFYPFFFVTEDEFRKYESDLFTDPDVRRIIAEAGTVSLENRDNESLTEMLEAPRETLQGESLVKIETVAPSDVSSLREHFDRTWEADVFFTNRFLIESGVKDGFSIPAAAGERVRYEDIEPLDEAPDVRPRMVTIDIEVWTGGLFPDTQDPKKPITAVTVHDSYDDEYRAAVLHPEATEVADEYSWGDIEWKLPDTVEDCPVHVYDDEAQMLADVNAWIVEKDPDLLTGWNSSRNEIGSGFDYPYWINRCKRVNEWTVKELSQVDKIFVSQRGTPVIGGREMFDMLQAYKKTQIHEKRSYSLGYISQHELGYGKEDIGNLDRGWTHEPEDFMQYNIRDVEAVVEIENVKNVLDMYDHIRSITGGDYSEIADSNIGIIDLLFLRRAKAEGYALPTSVRPDVQHYWGAYVFDPVAGKWKYVVYPDLASLYPNLFKDMNVSPETIVGFEEDLEESKFTKDDCHVVYVDTRDESTKKQADEPERTELYVLKPEVRESFVRDVIGDLIDMKYEYKKDRYADEAYEAVKRIVNSVYGVMGDSVSYGKGFRLFDWRIAEAITLAGRDVIKHTADEFEDYVQDNGYDEARIVSGDTDSCVLSIEQADGTWERSPLSDEERQTFIEDNPELTEYEDEPMAEALAISMRAAEYVDETYDEYMLDRYNMDENNMEVEIESYAEAAFFMPKKKRYAQWIRWDEGEIDDEIEVKGFELVRSDSSEITEDAQNKVIEMILREETPQDSVREYLREIWEEVTEGNVDLEDIGKPSAMSNRLGDYGWSEKTVDSDERVTTMDGEELETGDKYVKYYTAQPHIRGARYANEYIDGEHMAEGSKPLFFYANGVALSGDLPETYEYETETLNDPDLPTVNERGFHEEGRELDAISVEDVRNLPNEILIDWDKMAEKALRDPIERIVEVMDWDFDDLITEGAQSGLADFM